MPAVPSTSSDLICDDIAGMDFCLSTNGLSCVFTALLRIYEDIILNDLEYDQTLPIYAVKHCNKDELIHISGLFGLLFIWVTWVNRRE